MRVEASLERVVEKGSKYDLTKVRPDFPHVMLASGALLGA